MISETKIQELKKKYEKQLKLYRKIVKQIEDDPYHKEDVRYYHGNIYGVKEILEDLEELLKK